MRGAAMAAESGGRARGHVFISYVHDDSAKIDRLQRMLQGEGIAVWRDTSDLWPGEDWRTRIRNAITDHALVFIACFSETGLARPKSYQNEELVLAIGQLRMRQPGQPWLIPVRLDDCQIPDWEIGGGRTLDSIQRVDLFGDRLDDGFARLVTVIWRILGQPDAKEAEAENGEPGSAMRYQEPGSQAASSDRGDTGQASQPGPGMAARPHGSRLTHNAVRFVRHHRARVVVGSAVTAIVIALSVVFASELGSQTRSFSFYNEHWQRDCAQIDTAGALILGNGACTRFRENALNNALNELVDINNGKCLYYDTTGARDHIQNSYDLATCSGLYSDLWYATGPDDTWRQWGTLFNLTSAPTKSMWAAGNGHPIYAANANGNDVDDHWLFVDS